jgi:hypothetical protein
MIQMRVAIKQLRTLIRECVLVETWIEPLVNTEIVATRSFRPEYMGNTWKIRKDDVFKVMGASLPDAYTDKSYGIPNPILPFPNAVSQVLNYRVRLLHVKSNKLVFVSTNEFERFFDAAVEEEFGDEENYMPGETVFTNKPSTNDIEKISTSDIIKVANRPLTGDITKIVPRPPQS